MNTIITTLSFTAMAIIVMFVHFPETLHRKKKEAVELSTSVNTIKRKMDEVYTQS